MSAAWRAAWVAKRVASLTVGSVVGGVPPKELERIGRLFSGDIPKKPKRERPS